MVGCGALCDEQLGVAGCSALGGEQPGGLWGVGGELLGVVSCGALRGGVSCWGWLVVGLCGVG